MRQTHTDTRTSDNWLVWTLPVLLMLASLCGVTWLTLAPHPGRPILAVFPPWWDRSQTLQALVVADGRLVGLGARSDMLVAAESTPGLARRLREAGAWFLFDARNSAGCLAMVGKHG